MNPAPIHWAHDALITLGLVGAVLIVFVIFNACIIGGRADDDIEADFEARDHRKAA